MQIVIYYNKFRNIKEREKMLFSEEAIGFLFENHARDSKEWFKEHKADYHRLIEEPFAELITALTPIMNDIDSRSMQPEKDIKALQRRTLQQGRTHIQRERVVFFEMPA